jgi:Flp pilus assembly protein TadD
MKAYQLDPLSKGIEAQYGRVLSLMGKSEEAISHMKKMVEESPDFPVARSSLGLAYYRASRKEEAISELMKAVALSHDDPSLKADLAFLLALTGRNEEAKEILANLREISSSTYVSDAKMACVCYGLGDLGEAFKLLERAYLQRDGGLAEMRSLPETQGLCQDPRWVSLERRMGFRNE